MRITVDKIRDVVKQRDARIQKARSEVEDLNKRIETIDAECKAAVENVDSDTYYAKLQAKEKAAADLEVKQAFLRKVAESNPVSWADAGEAWNNYVSGYNTKLEKAMAAFKSKRAELNAMYAAMIELQNEACGTREFLAKAAGIPESYETLKMSCLPARHEENYGNLTLNGLSCSDPDAAYYLACYEQDHNMRFATLAYNIPREKNEMARVANVVANQKAF